MLIGKEAPVEAVVFLCDGPAPDFLQVPDALEELEMHERTGLPLTGWS